MADNLFLRKYIKERSFQLYRYKVLLLIKEFISTLNRKKINQYETICIYLANRVVHCGGSST